MDRAGRRPYDFARDAIQQGRGGDPHHPLQSFLRIAVANHEEADDF